MNFFFIYFIFMLTFSLSGFLIKVSWADRHPQACCQGEHKEQVSFKERGGKKGLTKK